MLGNGRARDILNRAGAMQRTKSKRLAARTSKAWQDSGSMWCVRGDMGEPENPGGTGRGSERREGSLVHESGQRFHTNHTAAR